MPSPPRAAATTMRLAGLRQHAALRSSVAGARKVAELTASPTERWRYGLFTLRKLIDAGVWEHPGVAGLSEKLAARLLNAMREYPHSVVPITRQLRRMRRRKDALQVVETLWETTARTSAEWALACAIVWYEDRVMWRGDVALARAMELAPDWPPAYEEQARNRSYRGNVAVAIEAAQRVIDLRSDPAATRYWSEFIGGELFKAGRYEEALDRLKQGEPINPGWTYWYKRAVCDERTGRASDAERCYARAAALRTPDIAAELKVGALHYYWGAIDEAATVLEASAASLPVDEVERISLLAKSLLRMERVDEALSLLRGRDRRLETAEVAKLAALAEELAGNADHAVDEYRAALRRHRDSSLHERLARSLAAAGRTHEAVTTWMAITQDDRWLKRLDPEPDPSFASLIRDATAHMRLERWNDAIQALRRLAASSSTQDNSQRLHRQLGRALTTAGRHDEALHAFMRGCDDLDPHPSEVSAQFAPLGPFERYAAAYETLPLEYDVVLYESFDGARTACNPLAVCRRLLAERPNLHHVWAVRDNASIHQALRNHPRVSFVRIHSDGYRLHLATAGTLVNNSTFPRYFTRRDGQRYLNTWHGVPWKSLGRDIADDPYQYDNVARNLLQATHLAFPDDHTARVMLETHDVATLRTAQMVVAGQPRMDSTLMMDDETRTALRTRLGLPAGESVVLYAPTWRGTVGSMNTAVEPYLHAIAALSQVAGARLLLRVHHFVAERLDYGNLPANVMIAPPDIDTNELLPLSDVLVTDYSSLIFDYAPLGRPIVKYVHDLGSYSAERGLYFSLDEVPGITCTEESELVRHVRQAVHRPEPYDWSSRATATTWENEDGHSTERVVAALFKETESERAALRHVLVAVASLYPNGITRSLRNLIASDPESAQDIQLLIPKGALANHASREAGAELHQVLDFTLSTQPPCFTRRENLAWRRLEVGDSPGRGRLAASLRTRMRRERRRIFGEARFAAVVDFDGYTPEQAALVGLGFPPETRKVFVLHNEFDKERRLKYPAMRSIGAILDNFDALASVSEPTRRVNQSDLEREFSVPPELHVTMPNTIDVPAILRQSAETMDDDLLQWFARPGVHVLVVARLSVEKNHTTLLDAFARLVAAGDKTLTLTFLGEGPRKAELVRQSKDLGIADRVLFAGHRPNPYPAMSRADALMLSSLHEGQPMVIPEALTLGTPVVSTNLPGPASLLQQGRFGMLVEPTLEGLVDALTAIAEGKLVAADAFDADAHQQAAIDAFRSVVGLDRIGESES